MAYKETVKYGPFKGKINKQTETVLGNDLMADILDKNFKITITHVPRTVGECGESQ